MPGFIVNAEGGTPGAPGISENAEYYYTYTWEIEELLGTYLNRLELHPKEISLPSFTTTKETIMGASLEYKFAKAVNWDDVKITWYDTEGLLDVIKLWREDVWDQVSGLQTADSYKKQSRLTTFLPDYTALNQWTLVNSWPSQIKHGDLTYTSSDIKVVEVTLTYDWAEEETGAKSP
jgi:hypothetical protein